MRKVVAIAAAMACVFALPGCVEITSLSAAQQDAIGAVGVTVQICLTHSTAGAVCESSDTNSGHPVGTQQTRLLLGFRVPAAAVAPATVTLAATGPVGTLQLGPSATYTSELQRLSPAPAGQKWVGFISAPVQPGDQHGDSVHTATAAFTLARGADGAPFAGPFGYLVTVGVRANDGNPPDANVDCGTDIKLWDDDRDTICHDFPKPPSAVMGGSIPTRDVGVINGGTVTAEQGQAISVPFEVRSTGTGHPVMSATAGTTAPNAQATASVAQHQPNGGAQSVPVSLNVGANTPPGTYDVTLSLSTGTQIRTGTWTVTIAAPAPPTSGGGSALPPPVVTTTPSETLNVAPVLTAAFAKGQKLAKALKKGAKLSVSCSEACTWTLTLKAGRTTVATGKGSRARAGKFTALAKFTSAAKKKYRRAKKLKLAATFRATDAGGLKSQKTASITIPR